MTGDARAMPARYELHDTDAGPEIVAICEQGHVHHVARFREQDVRGSLEYRQQAARRRFRDTYCDRVVAAGRVSFVPRRPVWCSTCDPVASGERAGPRAAKYGDLPFLSAARAAREARGC